ncbi:hypothetical protein [Streptomyces sp. NBC_01264]|uniref:hypothetical protein n=1 Tax=Streptomyces sp. NBC_01264 TaxID=2903804 RepID=UPI002258E41E|nr:hypothetical protein [Streptomyces sp. NBC_01264]MCX4778144.1 hypothetical protein [Streptomyces sp. NBC_01264]
MNVSRINREATTKTAREALEASRAMTGAASDSEIWRTLGALECTVEALLRVIDELTAAAK